MKQRARKGTLAVAASLVVISFTVISPANAERRSHWIMLPLMLRQAPLTLPGTIVQVVLQDGSPVAGARIVSLYTNTAGEVYTVERITDSAGQAFLPHSSQEIIVEIQYPVGLLPCPDSPSRIRVTPNTHAIKFVACSPYLSGYPDNPRKTAHVETCLQDMGIG